MLIALTRSVPPAIDKCELTHLAREPIDYARAVAQHALYEAALASLGCLVKRLPDLPGHPDSVFVEDTAVVFDDVAVMARPGAASRRGESATVEAALAPYRRLAFIAAPGTLDGGDVLVTSGRVFVGISGRTNEDGARQLAAILAPYGIETIGVRVTGCLHLKSAVTLARLRHGYGGQADMLLINPRWIDGDVFKDFALIEVDTSEPAAANVLRIGDRVICAGEHPRTRARLDAAGLTTLAIDAGELAKAEGGLTCGSLVFHSANS